MSDNFRKYIKKEHYPVQPANIKFKTSFKNCILESLKRRTWKESDHETDWDIFWTEKEWIHDVMDHMHLAPHQRVNHFRNYYELCRKDNLIKNLKRYKRALEKEGKLDEAAAYNFYPTTYNLPTEYAIFCEEFKKNNNHVWIMKPIGRSQGKGIFLFNKLSQVSQWKNESRWKPDAPQVENYIVQRYINNPLLIGGKKFDMRIYCLVTSYSPLVAYLYRDGFARFTHHRYDNEDITNTFVHLTNVAIQKTSENYDEKLGGKWDLRTLKLYLVSKYGQDAVSECFANIQQVIIRSLQSVQKVMINDKHCFELYGFDILLDDQLKPWLIEVNGSPSMTANTTHDFELKCNLLDDVFTIIDMEKVMTGQEEQIGGFDLICKGTPIRNDSSLFSSMLSCHNNRSQQLKKLAKIISSRLAQIYTQEKEEAKKNNRDKDIPSLSTTDSTSNGSRNKTKLAPKPIATNSVMAKPSRTTTLPPKQTATMIPKEPREPKETNSATRAVRTKPGETVKARTPISSSTTANPTSFSTSIPSPTVNNSTSLANSPGLGTMSPSYHKVSTSVSNALTMISNPNNTTMSSFAKQVQPTQSQADNRYSSGVGAGKMPSTFMLAGGASLNVNLGQSFEMRSKGRSIPDLPELSNQKPSYPQQSRTIEPKGRAYPEIATTETSNYKDTPKAGGDSYISKKKQSSDESAGNYLTGEDYE